MSKKVMNIEVRGIGFPNKGAELMLAALIERLSVGAGHRVVLPVSSDYSQRCKYQTFQLGRVVKFGFDFGHLIGLLPQRIRNMLGIVMPDEIDVIVDASGFTYGDQWGAQKAKIRLSGDIAKFKSQKSERKVILLPQAFGPFNDEALQSEMAEILMHSDLVFARDEDSYQFLTGVSKAGNVFKSPDFTNCYKPKPVTDFESEKYQVCFIPNAKMISMNDSAAGAAYVNFMANLLSEAVNRDLKPFILVHEGKGDLDIAQQIMRQAGVEVHLIQPSTTDAVKSVIGMSKLVVSSRFHGLVSALSQNVPVIATGWSHKYRMLLQDYHIEEYLFDVEQPGSDATKAMSTLCEEPDIYAELVNKLKSAGAQEQQKTQEMWQKVIQLLDGNGV